MQVITKKGTSYQCAECGLRYAEKEWAEKCEAWCRERHTCNIEITTHAAENGGDEEKAAHELHASPLKTIFGQPLYLFVAIDGALALGLLYWWLLSKTTTWVTFSGMYGNVPLYFWPYVLFTLLSMILFGMSLAVAVYAWRNSGLHSIKDQGGNAFGAIFGAFAAACPICGSFLLSAIGIAGGVAVLPFKGLELKFLSAAFFGAALFLSTRKLSQAKACETCAVEPAAGGQKSPEQSDSLLSYRTLLAVFFLILFSAAPLWSREQVAASAAAKDGTLLMNAVSGVRNAGTGNQLYGAVVAKVLPRRGFQTKIVLGDAVVKLAQNGIIDIAKFKDVYKDRGITEKELALLTTSSSEPLAINADNAGIMINLLWPLGLANKTQFNEKSPVNGKSLFDFASTGGWTLGREDNGGKYFNKYEIVQLTPEQEAVALEVAQNVYRPCCGNSAFFQDCNHGSAMLGLIELGAAQGLSTDDLYRVALQFNSFWFPQTYIQTALYYKLAKNIDWENVDPKEIIGFDYSSGPGWAKNIARPLQEIIAKNPNLVPQKQGGGGCGV